MGKINDHADLVEKILKEHPDTRDDDHKLYVWIVSIVKPELMRAPFGRTFWDAKSNGLPSYESITRARRKAQEKHPDLRGKAWEKRHDRENDYIRNYGRRAS